MFRFVGETLRRLRKEKGWTIARLAAESSTGGSQISRIETGKQDPKIGVLGKLLDSLGVSRSEFFRRYDLVEAEGRAAGLLDGEEGSSPRAPSRPVSEPALQQLGGLLASWSSRPRGGYLDFEDYILTFNVVPKAAFRSDGARSVEERGEESSDEVSL